MTNRVTLTAGETTLHLSHARHKGRPDGAMTDFLTFTFIRGSEINHAADITKAQDPDLFDRNLGTLTEYGKVRVASVLMGLIDTEQRYAPPPSHAG